MGFWRAVMAGAVGLGCLFGVPAAERPEALEATARRILKEFPEVAHYYTLAAERLAWNYLLNPQRKPDFAAAEETCRSALSHLGANLSPALVYAQQLLIWRHHRER